MILLAALLLVSAARAQEEPPPPPAKVDGPTISTLIRTTMVALHQANFTGNYTVLRDLGASVMQASNSAADLADLFADFRKKRFNLAPTVLYDPVLDQPPKLTTSGKLQLVGHFATKPQEVVFDFMFLWEGGVWRIGQISVGTRIPAAGETAAAKPKAGNGEANPVPLPRTRPAQ